MSFASTLLALRSGPRLMLLGLVLVIVIAVAAMVPAGTGLREVTVQEGDLILGVDVVGTLESEESVQLGPPQLRSMWNFRIAMLAPEGTEVQPGRPVIRFDTSQLEETLREKVAERDSAEQEITRERTRLERQLRDSELRLAEARARLRKAQLKVEVPPELAEANELDQARIDHALARREVDHLEEKLEFERRQGAARVSALERKRDRAAGRVEEIQEHIRSLTVEAPRAGKVIYVTDRYSGEKKKVGDQVWRAAKVVEIPDLDHMRAEGEVDEADAGQIEAGLPVSLRLDAHPDVEYRGVVTRIHRTVEKRSPALPVKVVRLDIELAQTDAERMRPGMRFRGRVEVERIEDAVLAPAEAVFGTADGPVVWVDGWFGPRAVRPRVGARNEQWVEILEGLEAGDAILVESPEEES